MVWASFGGRRLPNRVRLREIGRMVGIRRKLVVVRGTAGWKRVEAGRVLRGKLSLACKLFENFSDMGVDDEADLATAVLDKLIKGIGGYLDIVMYNTLINALGKAGRIEEVNKLFEQMKTSGINPDFVTFNALSLKFIARQEIEKLRYQKTSIMGNKDDPS
ncbi:hypothetical protein FH972_003712 [Carpinus fangiana]|uniref:Pentacotripeptide-repeat region of PRORP domain-containing protein n=1 Tax=Carpinus fangiana TaxID=176857 RepID=A0A5N6QL96_9ROSI|nr:hypothetical protein FH972_003712 [Carpinus fangiana]